MILLNHQVVSCGLEVCEKVKPRKKWAKLPKPIKTSHLRQSILPKDLTERIYLIRVGAGIELSKGRNQSL
ncbi:hypothetical protein CMK15_10625 [Candidatus Poribacteria bacterium]|nr:hypothetical protein [Candidatus Poribacteria bacterium]